MELAGTGIWSPALRYADRGLAIEAAAEIEQLGYSAMWIPDPGGDVFTPVGELLGATTHTVVATGILNIWKHTPAETARAHAALTARHGARFLLGLGVSHGPRIEAVSPGSYRQPIARMAEYLDGLDASHDRVPSADRVIAALGPRMLELARTRTAGSHPYLVTPEHTAAAREGLGHDALLAPEQAVVLSTDAEGARAFGRAHLQYYVGLPNYVNNWRRLGFTEDDVSTVSDRLVDALVAWGDEDAIARRVRAHRDAGAQHVCIQVLGADPNSLMLDTWRRLAPVLA